MRKNHSKEVEQFWREKVEEWKKSGVNGHRYCKDKEISYPRFSYWKEVIERKEKEEKEGELKMMENFLKLEEGGEEQPESKESVGIELTYRGLHLHLKPHFDRGILKELLTLLREELPC